MTSIVEASRITHRDTASYCNILLDDNGRKQIVRLYFNNPKNKKLEIYSIDENGTKVSEKVPIDNTNEIYKYADKFKAIVTAYEEKAMA